MAKKIVEVPEGAVKEYRKEAGVTGSNFSTCVHRLVKKGVISKDYRWGMGILILCLVTLRGGRVSIRGRLRFGNKEIKKE